MGLVMKLMLIWLDYTLVDSEYMLPIPEEVKAVEAGPILCAGSIPLILNLNHVIDLILPSAGTTVYRALKSAQLAAGQWVAIVGAGGGLGHLYRRPELCICKIN